MELRKYDPGRDFEIIKNWIDDERTHATTEKAEKIF